MTSWTPNVQSGHGGRDGFCDHYGCTQRACFGMLSCGDHADDPMTAGAPLPAKYQDEVRDGFEHRTDIESRSEARFSVVMSMRNKSWSRVRIERVLLDRNNGISAAYWNESGNRGGGGRTVRQAQSRVERDIRRADEKIADSPAIRSRQEAVQHLGMVRAAADAADWSGRSGGSQRTVLAAFLAVASRTNKVMVGMSLRQLSEEANVGRGTAERAVKALQAAGWLTVMSGGEEGLSAVYSLHVPATLTVRETVEVENLSVPEVSAVMLHEAFTWRGLSATAAQVWVVLSDVEGQTQKAVAAASGKSLPTVRKHLRALKQYGLVAQNAEGGWLRLDADLDAVAVNLDTHNSRQERRNRNAIERDLYVRAQADIRARREAERIAAKAERDRWVPMEDGTFLNRETGEVRDGLTAEQVKAMREPQDDEDDAPAVVIDLTVADLGTADEAEPFDPEMAECMTEWAAMMSDVYEFGGAL
ncbi:hypothetical protein [Kineococcus rhizosphaerae]|uniref:Uncharacterized protein n=1 Tax=Kineococcus rhizosphaerae TaxID=559628 RepID=A0A2T0QTK6_9ACTN|nr:hypothetical protein [Kineococcus rhizosphaerae]PRY08413.1 hypothetical protein CLV37_1248 [Kineococcus rhizosphaerae]